MQVKVFSAAPNAKINIGLLIKGKRADGYHNLETLFYPIALSDRLTLFLLPGLNKTLVHLMGVPITDDGKPNIVYRAWQLLQADFPDLPHVHIYLDKKIPAGAGLGGGSSDAALTLIGLNQLAELHLSTEQLSQYAKQLGADVPFFLYNCPMLATGKGDILKPYSLKLPYRIEVITPPVHSNTIEAYKALKPEEFSIEDNLEEILLMPVETWKHNLRNDFEPSVFRRFPQLKVIKDQLYAKGAVYASLSGSGSALYGLFPLNHMPYTHFSAN
jgi:4-diphosphocytidyl-2-C-methyl-D-erythritol kinase